MRIFIQNITYGGKGVKCRGKKSTYPKCLEVRFPNLESSRTILPFARILLKLKNMFAIFLQKL